MTSPGPSVRVSIHVIQYELVVPINQEAIIIGHFVFNIFQPNKLLPIFKEKQLSLLLCISLSLSKFRSGNK